MSIVPVERVSILFVDPGAAELYLPSLRTRYEVSAVSTERQAIRALRTFQPTVVITELALPEGDGVAVCRHSKAFPVNPPSVLATTGAPERVPDALVAGCDAVLLKPFAPNLLFARLGLLLRQRAAALRDKAMWERSRQVLAGTNIMRHDAACPSCGTSGVVSFDAAGRGRMWYACVPCRNVWIAPAISA